MEKIIVSKLEKEFIIWKKKIIRFVNVETECRLQYCIGNDKLFTS
jgi:hypothetical protein